MGVPVLVLAVIVLVAIAAGAALLAAVTYEPPAEVRAYEDNESEER